MGIALLFGTFFIALFAGIPIAFALGIASLFYALLEGIPLAALAQNFYAGIDKFTLLCIPGFLLAGNLMNQGNVTHAIVDFSSLLFGRIRGGLSLANIAGSMLFGGISGTAAANTASIGAVMIPGMYAKGYDKPFAAAVTAASSTVGPIIPPSLPMIIVGTLTGVSVGKLFVAGAVPGILLGLAMMFTASILAVVKQHPREPWQGLKKLKQSFFYAIPALLLTLLILFGILGSLFTPTEASIVASIYAFFIAAFFYKGLKIRDISPVLLDTIKATAALMALVGMANVFGWVLTSEKIPQAIAAWMLSLTTNPYLMLLFINLLLLFVGTFMETIAALVILFPTLLSVVVPLGVEPVHFGIIVVLNLVIGLTTPPVGVCLFIACNIGQLKVWQITKAILPFLLCNILVLFLITYIPQLSLWLPSFIG